MIRWILLLLTLTLVTNGCGDDSAEENQAEPVQEDDLPQEKTDAADLTNQGKGDFSLDICKAREWYDDGECDWFCPRRDADCNAEPLGPEPSGRAAKYPIILAHGFMGSPTNLWAFLDVKEALEADGNIVYEGEVPPFHSPAVRAERLAPTIDLALSETGADKVNIIAHSMGGIDSRYLISTLGYGDRVASLTTISSPHRGTNIADTALGLTPEFADPAIDALLKMVGRTFSEEADMVNLRASLEGIAVANMETFNQNNPNDDRVFYQSWAGMSSILGFRNKGIDEACEGQMLLHQGTYDRTDALLWIGVPFVAGIPAVPHDGMSTVEAARWGEFHGCIPADHLDEVGQLDGEPDLDTGFDHIRFYRNVTAGLADRGF